MPLFDMTARDLRGADNQTLISAAASVMGELQHRFADGTATPPVAERMHNSKREYNLMLDEVYGNTVIAGAHYPTSKAFARVDPRSYHNGYLQYANLIAAYTANR